MTPVSNLGYMIPHCAGKTNIQALLGAILAPVKQAKTGKSGGRATENRLACENDTISIPTV